MAKRQRATVLSKFFMLGFALFLVALATLFGDDRRAEAETPPQPLLNPANGHYYQVVSVVGGIDWFAADVAAS